jgi:hypothetical protein
MRLEGVLYETVNYLLKFTLDTCVISFFETEYTLLLANSMMAYQSRAIGRCLVICLEVNFPFPLVQVTNIG